MIELVSQDRPEVVCLQELPVWGLERLEDWSGMQVFPAVARRPRLPGRTGPLVTRLYHGFFRSALVGQANAILVAPALEAEDLGLIQISHRRLEPRVVQAVRVADRFVVANFHASTDLVAARAELERAQSFAEGLARSGEAVVLAGDLNLVSPEVEGYSEPTDGIDHVLVRGAPASEPVVWLPERRVRSGGLLSDHAPVEVTIGE